MWIEVLRDKGENDIVFVVMLHEERRKCWVSHKKIEMENGSGRRKQAQPLFEHFEHFEREHLFAYTTAI